MQRKRWRNAQDASRSLSRAAAASSIATATCWYDRSFRKRLRGAPRDREYVGDDSKTAEHLGKLDPSVATAMRDRHLWFVWIARKVPHDLASRVRSLNLLGVDLKEEETGLRVDTAGRLASTLLGFVGTDENGLDGIELLTTMC